MACGGGGGNQRRTSPHFQGWEMKILNISFPRVGIESTTPWATAPQWASTLNVCAVIHTNTTSEMFSIQTRC